MTEDLSITSVIEKNHSPNESTRKVQPSRIELSAHYELRTLKFIKQYQARHDFAPANIQVNMRSIVRKIDKHMMLLMLFAYFLQFLDKVVLNYSNIMGLARDINLTGNQFSDLPTYFFVAFLIFEPVQGMFLHRFPASKILGANIIIWGITTACCSAAQNFAGMMALRVLLGCSESAISPCLVLLTSSWFNARESAFRMGFWYCGLGLGQIFGGVISFLFQLISLDASFDGWRIMFLVVGVINLCCGTLCYFYLPNDPVNCNFLNEDEKYALVMKLTETKLGGASRKLNWKQVRESLSDITFYLFFCLTASISFSSNTITTFSSTDILSFGFTSKEAALLNMPSGAVSIISTMVSAYFIMKGFSRGIAIIILCLPAVTGGALMSFLPTDNKGGLLAGIYLINTIVAPLAIIYAWIGSCVSGHTKKVCFNISVMIGFAFGNITGPQSYRVKDKPRYLPAKISMLATQACAIVFASLLLVVYILRNKKRDKALKDVDVDSEDEIENAWTNKTDFENPYFRYCY